jgi:hypothetical protein
VSYLPVGAVEADEAVVHVVRPARCRRTTTGRGGKFSKITVVVAKLSRRRTKSDNDNYKHDHAAKIKTRATHVEVEDKGIPTRSTDHIDLNHDNADNHDNARHSPSRSHPPRTADV